MDMLASPNYILYVLDGSTAPPSVSSASRRIDQLFVDRYELVGLPWTYSAMSGGSDFYPFIMNGVPASGVLCGASGIKSSASREKFGGLANAADDPCYHQPCDSLLNINKDALGYTSDATASVLQTLVQKKDLRKWLSQNTTHTQQKERVALTSVRWNEEN